VKGAGAIAVAMLACGVGCRDRAKPPPTTPGAGTGSGSGSGSVAGSGSASGSGSVASGSGPGSGSAPLDAPVDAALAPPVDAAVDAAPLAVVDAPIKWPPARDAAMLAYRRHHSDRAATDTTIAPRMIVLHYTAGSSAKGTRAYFDNLYLEKARTELREGGDVNVSAHYLVDRDGTIYKLMPEDRMARHAIGVNHIAIGVENVGDEKDYPLTDAQVTADAALIRDLRTRWPIELLVGHHEVRSLEGTPWFVELDPSYRNRKGDPGPRFMAKVRAAVADLGLAGPPAAPAPAARGR
jgi:hypothetical protein